MSYLSMSSPLGALTVFEEDGLLVSLDWGKPGMDDPSPAEILHKTRHLLESFFDGVPTVFDLPLAPAQTTFQQKIRDAMLLIPFGETRSYGAVAIDLGSSARAVGGACGRNPLPIIVPCHRVIAANGDIGGYSGAGGLDTKRFLIDLECRR